MTGFVEGATIIYPAANAGLRFYDRWRRRPILWIERVVARNVVYPVRSERVARFVIATVRNLGRTRAEGCQGYFRSQDTLQSEYKLHWADTPYSTHRDSAETVDIPRGQPRDLDVTFSLGRRQLGPEEKITTRVPTTQSGSIPTMVIVAPTSSVGESVSTDPATIRIGETVYENPAQGGWVAVPIALSVPTIDSQAYLARGSYAGVVGVVDRLGNKAELPIIIRIGETWSDLSASLGY